MLLARKLLMAKAGDPNLVNFGVEGVGDVTLQNSDQSSSVSLVSDNSASNGTALRFNHTGGESGEETYSLNKFDGRNLTDVESLMRVRGTEILLTDFGSVLRGSMSGGNLTCYRLDVGHSSGDVRASKYLDHVYNSIGDGDGINTDGSPDDGATWLNIRTRINGSTISASVWPESITEPSTWMLNVTDTSISGNGFIGFRAWEKITDVYIDWISIGINGDDALPPTA